MRRCWCTSFAGLAACFAPVPVPGSPCPDGVCPTGLVCSSASKTCERTETDAALLDGPPLIDAAPGCFGIGLVVVCPTESVSAPLVLAGNIDTDGLACIGYTGTLPGQLCLLAGTQVMVSGTVTARGSRPLVVLGTDSVQVLGTLDAASRRVGNLRGAGSSPVRCPRVDASGDRGGPGGTLGGRGGFGGAGETNGTQPSGAVSTVDSFRAGCDGGSANASGEGGAGGGAIYVIAGTKIVVQGSINASGAGGGAAPANGGGGGGGSGGMIGLDAPTIELSGSVFANGGGGGASDVDSTPGGESPSASQAAVGGRAGDGGGADGGNGSANTMLDGRRGDDGADGGGGGGGAAGIIRVFPPRMLSGASPPPS